MIVTTICFSLFFYSSSSMVTGFMVVDLRDAWQRWCAGILQRSLRQSGRYCCWYFDKALMASEWTQCNLFVTSFFRTDNPLCLLLWRGWLWADWSTFYAAWGRSLFGLAKGCFWGCWAFLSVWPSLLLYQLEILLTWRGFRRWPGCSPTLCSSKVA